MTGSLNGDIFHIPEEPVAEVIKEKKIRTVEANVSYYTASVEECGKDDGITASGVMAQEGVTVAADDLPFGTKVIIDGVTYVVQDRFNGNYRDRIDIYLEGHDAISRANEYGRRTMIMHILEEDQ